MLAATAAIACVGGMAMAAVAPGVAHASPAGRETAASSDGLLPPHVFAPYYFNTADTLAATSKASGAKYLTLAFLQTAKPGSCTVDWNGDPSMPVGKTYAAGIAAVQAAGGSKWSAATQIDSSALTGVSCPDTTFCVAVDARRRRALERRPLVDAGWSRCRWLRRRVVCEPCVLRRGGRQRDRGGDQGRRPALGAGPGRLDRRRPHRRLLLHRRVRRGGLRRQCVWSTQPLAAGPAADRAGARRRLPDGDRPGDRATVGD
jgi:hypothetical protein